MISVILPTYNRSAFLERSISSIINQTLTPAELIIVDDGSTDETADVIEALKRESKVPIRYIYQINSGASSARNVGIKKSISPYLAFLDSDDWWHEKKLEIQFSSMVENHDFLVSHTRELWFRGGKKVNQKKKHDPLHGEIFHESLRMCMVGMSTVMIKKVVFEKFGLFDEDLPCCEDYDLWLRLGSSIPFLLVGEALTFKDGGREDQLSAIHRMGMDVFRITSLCNLLDHSLLSPAQREQTLEELERKCRIYGNGCLKHGRQEEGEYYLAITQKYITAEGMTSE